MTVSLSLKLGKKEFNKSFTVKVTTHVVANSDSSQPNKAANENLNPKKHNDNGSAWTQCPNGEWNITGVKDGPNKNVDGTVKDKQLTTDAHQLLPERKEDGTIKIDKNGDVMKVDDSGYNIHYTDNSNTAGCIGVKNEMQMKAIIYLFRLNERIDPKSSTLKVIGSEE